MKLPWKLKDELEEKEQKIEELEDQIEELEDEKQSWKERFEAEKDRRSELSRKKQEAEEKLNRLQERLEDREPEEEVQEEAGELDFRSPDFREAKGILQRLGSISSDQRELVTVYCPNELDDLSDLKSLKNSIDRDTYSMLKNRESFVAFIDSELGAFILEMSPFFDEKVEVAESFETEELLNFLETEKSWALVSAGETTVYREEDGDVEELDRITSRVDKEHSKGGFSQGRFERKREQQIEKHMDQAEELLRDYEEVFVLGDSRFCEELPGTYLGGFDPNVKRPDQFYGFRFAAVF